MENKGKRIGGDNGEIQLPEAMIQLIQSYLSCKEAARTTILSKSWYTAWLTRPVLDLDCRDFPREPSSLFEEFAKKTMQRYQDSSLKIGRFRLRMDDNRCSWAHDLIVNAMNIGATDVQYCTWAHELTLPKEVLGSQTLLRLSASGNGIQTFLRFGDGSFARCSRLQSLSLDNVNITSDDGFKNIILCCGLIEELSLAYIHGIKFSRVNLPKLHKLRRLTLDFVDVDDDTFFTDFTSRFPCLKDLEIVLDYDGYTRVGIASTSLQTIHLTATGGSCRAKFDVPNIRKFTFRGYGLPSQLLIKGGSTEWELDMSIENKRIPKNRFPKDSWFLKLNKLLTKFRLSRISLCVELDYECKKVGRSEHDLNIEVVPKPPVLENLFIETSSTLCLALLLRLLGICRPKFINDMLYSWSDANASFAILYNRLMQKSVTPNCGIPDQDMFGKFGLKKVNMEVYEKVDAKWDAKWLPIMLEKPLDPSKSPVVDQRIRYELIWD